MSSSGVRLYESDSPLAREFHNRIQKAMVYIERTCLASLETFSGTGTVIGYQGNNTDGWLPIVASAGHLLCGTVGAESRFRVQQFDWSIPHLPASRTLEFSTGGTDGRSPGTVIYTGPNHEIIDVGLLRCPSKCTDGSDFFPLGRDQLPSGNLMSIQEEAVYSAEGTKVAWAGFAGVAQAVAQRPQPCFFEGCVSALILREDYQLYLIDGHNTFGVSGGPVWAILEDTKQATLIGVVSGYRFDGSSPQVPGFMHAVPIQPLRTFLEKIWGAKTRQLIPNNSGTG